MTSNHHAPYALGYTRATMAGTAGSEGATRSESLKSGPSSDRRLQLACVKAESLVMAGQHTAVSTFPGLVHTARHPTKVGKARSRWPNRKAGAVDGRPDDWGAVVTREPYRTVPLDPLLAQEALRPPDLRRSVARVRSSPNTRVGL